MEKIKNQAELAKELEKINNGGDTHVAEVHDKSKKK